ncbi:hypothetical protein A5893_02650 [Pedobacter psychrophilus]|uniref:Secretion system C-terminal sorting domain-containing protein n=1 Tax=Pedobacter psychrophilus TaxID=1826909 RepID=A0A179DML2_9SPHI|nr:T9SS type A sorting domain-containing protein [Pedobacter psychrophilus]OAQ42032.1 hypothetical protein A5893_02650 [Pedobacter psychrophilus]
MRKTLLTTGLIAFAFGAFAQFTANRLVVSQYGNETDPLDANAVPVILKEFKVTGPLQTTPTFTLALPTTVSGANQQLTGNTATGNEGLLTLSPNGTYLTAFGYAVNAGITLSGNNNRTLGLINANGAINTTTYSTTATLGNPRCAITIDGTGFWLASSGAGVRYIDINTQTASTGVHSTVTAFRSVNIYNGQLYETTNSSAGAHVGTITSASDANKLPKSTVVNNANTTPVALPGMSTLPTFPNQIVLLKSTVGAGDPNLIYATNDDTGKIEKWRYNPLAMPSAIWELKGTVTASVATAALSVKGITGRIIGDTVFVYANTNASIVAFRDTLSSNKTISDANTTLTTLATAPANTLFKGIAFTPGTDASTIPHIVLPIKLSSFTGKSTLNGAQLSWTTSSEKDNNHFDILRSTDGTQFSKIGEVAGNGNSDVALNYSFLDKNAVTGANYYKLNQVDNNGKSEEFGPVVVTVNGQAAAISVYANKASGQINVNVFSNKSGEGVLNVYDAGGKVVAKQNVSLQVGSNQINLSSQNAGAGLHIASLTFAGETLTKKFIFQ